MFYVSFLVKDNRAVIALDASNNDMPMICEQLLLRPRFARLLIAVGACICYESV